MIRLQTAKPAGSDNLVDVELLRPLAWIDQGRAVVGSRIRFELAELGISGPADVLAIEPCPEIEPGRGRVITGTFTTARCSVLELRLSNGEVLEPTPPHRFFSEGRQDWVAANDLRAGEHLRTKSGQAVTVESITLKTREHRVYNLEVEQEHHFYVGEAGVLVHNAYPTGEEPETTQARRDSRQADLEELDPHNLEFYYGHATEGHHSIPKEILAKLPPEIANHPDIRGRRGNPNVVDIPTPRHELIHEGPGGGWYNQRVEELIIEHGGYEGASVPDLVKIRQQAMGEARQRL